MVVEEEQVSSNKKVRCEYWLPKKNRFCANSPLPPSLFCGNHSTRPHHNWVPCPIDPSHSVLQDNLDCHLKRCPFFKQSRSLSLQPYYHKGINRGIQQDEEEEEEEADVTSDMKRHWVYNLTLPQLSHLLSKIRTIHNSISKDIPFSYNVPQACNLWIHTQVDRKIPYQEKHVLQQASILGNLEHLGVLNCSDQASAEEQSDPRESQHVGSDSPAVVEFGAGRGYLTQILADCYGIKKVFLVERKAYKLKADRSLRQKESLVLERLRIDIEDLNLNAVESLRGVPYLAIGKHLCGPATDLTLRCCLGECYDQEDGAEPSVYQQLRGIAVATCCHHLCQWKYYINKRYMLNLGMSKEDFHALTWFTSWAVDADHGSTFSDDSYLQSPMSLGDDTYDNCAREAAGILKNMKAVDRAALGFMCKDIIDIGRLKWIEEHGLEANLVKYVPISISPENRLLLGKAINSKASLCQ